MKSRQKKKSDVPVRFPIFWSALLIFFIASAQQILAHPLGNFSINRYSRLELSAERIHLYYVLDMAEIPTFQERNLLDTNADGAIDELEHTRYLMTKTEELWRSLQLTIHHVPVQWKMVTNDLTFLPGQGGLSTLRLSALFEAPLPALNGPVWELEYRDDNYRHRLGWKEVVVHPLSGINILTADVPQQDQSDELRRYPEDMLSIPLEVQSAQVTFAPGVINPSTDPNLIPTPALLPRSEERFAALIASETLSLPIVLFALVMAMGLGAVHALSPGHGKTVVGAYLVGARGTAKHALFLGLTVTITHTAGVFALGIITLFASHYVLPEQLYPWLGTVSGLIVMGMGVMLFVRRVRNILHPAAHAQHYHHHHTEHHHDHAHHHAHEHTHEHGHYHTHSHSHHAHTHEAEYHPYSPSMDEKRLLNPLSLWERVKILTGTSGQRGHSHLPPGADGTPVTWRSLLALGVSGGLLPCPSALVVLLSAIALHRVGFGLLLIVAFSMGLAGVLTGIGLLFVYAHRFLERFHVTSQRLQLLPMLSAFVITLVGLGITAQALSQTGWLSF
jgi:ABC-type nickel/cobalt efflux system permease component RcnA